MKDPQQEIFTAIKLDIQRKGYKVFDGMLPPDKTPYPFIYLGDMQQIDDENKSAVFGNVFFTIHIWHNSPKKRGTVSGMLLEVKDTCRHIEHTENFDWYVKNINQRIVTDNTTKAPLLHGILEVEFKFS